MVEVDRWQFEIRVGDKLVIPFAMATARTGIMLCMDLYAGRSQESINGTCCKRLRDERSPYILDSMIFYIGLALYKAFISWV